jgi:hypothetical protein
VRPPPGALLDPERPRHAPLRSGRFFGTRPRPRAGAGKAIRDQPGPMRAGSNLSRTFDAAMIADLTGKLRLKVGEPNMVWLGRCVDRYPMRALVVGRLKRHGEAFYPPY